MNSLVVDLHAHWLPQVDDGAQSIEEGINMIKGLQDLGFLRLVVTPHIMLGLYDNQPKNLVKEFEKFKLTCLNRGLDIQLELAAEYMLDEGFIVHLERGNLLAIDNQYLLIEMSMMQPYQALREIIFEISNKGYKPILAHPERYLYYQKNIDDLEELKEMGCSFQLNGLSYSGYYGRRISRFCRLLLKHDLFDFWGSDVHHPNHIKKLTLDYGEHRFKNKTIFND